LLFGLSGGILMSLILPVSVFSLPMHYTKTDWEKFNKLRVMSSNDSVASGIASQLKSEFKKDELDKEKISKLFKEYKTRLSELKKEKTLKKELK